MSLINKLSNLFGTGDDTPEIIDDMYARRGIDALELFHAELGIISEKEGISYFEAFVKHINHAGINVQNRGEIEQHLWKQGLCYTDIQQLVDEFYKIAG